MCDYVPHGSYLAGDVDAWRASDLLTDGYDRVDPSPRDQQIKHVRKSGIEVRRSDDSPDATWRHEKRRISFKRGLRKIAIGQSIELKLN